MNLERDLQAPLRRYWGYDSFRPLQERIVRSLLGGRDACVVMPTGGGKSLCYQLPAAMLGGKTAIVVSPLIALMQDQVAQLAQMGIAAAQLNSAQKRDEQAATIRDAMQGKFRLLYLSPERLADSGTVGWLQEVPISFFAIDEAHCISEWGHEFRPEYRQLKRLRVYFPGHPIAAFTASATQRVRHDIMDQLQLRQPDKYIASFHRPNLRYVAKECVGRNQNGLLLRAMRKYRGSNVIIYSPTISRVEETVDFLEEHGISAVGYHGKMDPETRRRNQERWMSDEIPVLVGTLAFGLGINKAAVRAVIHLSLPKSIEQFYQEAGRAGRDGLPADCLLLWQKRDAGLLAYFTGQISDPNEQARAWGRYDEIRGFAESRNCRHKQICSHFGEKVKWKSCGACDVCGCEINWLSETVEAKRPKRRGAVASARQPRGLRPAARAGSERWQAATHQRSEQSAPDQELREYLREWRRARAQEQNVPAFVVMHDTSLDALCATRPKSLAELRGVFGFGERKTEMYGRQILDALAQFAGGARATPSTVKKAKPTEETIGLLAEGRTFAEIASIRGRQLPTIYAMGADLVERGELEFDPAWLGPGKQASIEEVCARLGLERLGPVKEALPPEITFGEIRLVVARMRLEHRKPD
ncbi:MAG: RecQ family ATP-dependent DNA helicase [Acidipila sp.]|nr:RecQ family ATP-dependent DNA helicase [Acidipila sp.]